MALEKTKLAMNEIEYKLESGRVVLVTEAVDRLVDLIMETPEELEATDHPLTFLKDKCTSEDPVVSLTASKGFLKLVASGFLEIVPAMSVAMSMLPSSQNYLAITSILSGILTLIVERNIASEPNYICQWSLNAPQHPMVLVLQQHPAAVNDILSQVESICLYNQRLSPYSVELMRSIFLWVLCDPNTKQSIETYHRTINILSALEHCPGHTQLLLECLCWQQTSSSYKHAYCIYTCVLDWAISKNKDNFVTAIIVVLANIAIEIIRNGDDPRPCFTYIQKALSYPGIEVSCEVLLAILTEAIPICPISYSNELISLCKNVHKLCGSSISSYIFSSALLQWLFYPTSLAHKFTKEAREIFETTFKISSPVLNLTLKLSTNKFFNFIKKTHNRIYVYTEIIVNHSKLTSNKEIFGSWIDRLKQGCNEESKFQIVLYLYALLLKKTVGNDSTVDKIKILGVLKDLVTPKKELATEMLPVILSSLKRTKIPSEIIEFLRTIVYLAVTKENVPAIVQLLEGFASDKSFPKSFLIDLYIQLVDKQTRCYPYLQEFLVEYKSSSSDADWELFTAKASAVKYICEEKAANFGAEMVPVISSLLNRSSDANTSAAYCFVLQALVALWQSHIVAPASTWRALAPRIGKEKRPLVQVGVCQLLSEVPNLSTGTPEFEAFESDAISKLWSYVVDSHYPEVTNAALNALSRFKVENMTLKQIPEIYRKGVQLPPAYCKTPSDAARKPEDVLTYIPSECWQNLFKYTNQSALDGVSDFCHKLIEREVMSYRSGVYATTDGQGSKGEPQTAQYLPAASVVRGLLEFVRKQTTTPLYDIPECSYLECLRCLSRPRSRPLPPMQWNFLLELGSKGRHYSMVALSLAAQQATISTTALRFLQNYIPALHPSSEREDEVMTFIESLPILCKIESAIFIRDTIYAFLDSALLSIKKDVSSKDSSMCTFELFTSVMKSLKECLKSDQINENNKNMISDLIEHYYGRLDCDHQFWAALVDVCCELSSEYLERMTAPSSWWEVTSVSLRKAVWIRCKLATISPDENRLAWINEIIDAAILLPREHTFVLQMICPALMAAKCDRDWLLQLMARTQVHMVEATADENSVKFLCDVVILSMIMFSNYFIYTWRDNESLTTSKAARLDLFPQAFSRLFVHTKSKEWIENSGQVLEWLHHSRCNKFLLDQYSESFYMGLFAGRESPYMKKKNVWTKFLSTCTPISLE